MASDTINIYVSNGQLSTPYYQFYSDSEGNTEITDTLELDTTKTYVFHRLNGATNHAFYISDAGYEQSSTDITLTPTTYTETVPDGYGGTTTNTITPSATSGIKNTATLTLSFNESFDAATAEVIYYCTLHSDMVGTFTIANNNEETNSGEGEANAGEEAGNGGTDNGEEANAGESGNDPSTSATIALEGISSSQIEISTLNLFPDNSSFWSIASEDANVTVTKDSATLFTVSSHTFASTATDTFLTVVSHDIPTQTANDTGYTVSGDVYVSYIKVTVSPPTVAAPALDTTGLTTDVTDLDDFSLGTWPVPSDVTALVDLEFPAGTVVTGAHQEEASATATTTVTAEAPLISCNKAQFEALKVDGPDGTTPLPYRIRSRK